MTDAETAAETMAYCAEPGCEVLCCADHERCSLHRPGEEYVVRSMADGRLHVSHTRCGGCLTTEDRLKHPRCTCLPTALAALREVAKRGVSGGDQVVSTATSIALYVSAPARAALAGDAP